MPIADRPFTERVEGPHILPLPNPGTLPTKGRGIAAAVLARRSGAGGTGERARLAVLLHALAGDLAVRRTGQAALVASDLSRLGLSRLFRRWRR